jgi:hypothetical protein
MEEAIWNMSVVEHGYDKTAQSANNIVYYAQALDSYGEFKDRPKILTLMKEALPQATDVSSNTIQIFLKHANEKDILDLAKRIKEPTKLYWIIRSLGPKLADNQFLFEAGRDLMDALRLAASADEANSDEKKNYHDAANRIGKQYKSIEESQTKSHSPEAARKSGPAHAGSSK